eukprot:Skav203658  [mRNA]  locus=scaffold2755:65268:66686:- [translate_table: standard]
MAWRHRALSFGATGSVWGFNRVADSLVALSRKLLLTCSLHYVDDFGGIEDDSTCESSFLSFNDLFSHLGFRMKPRKAQPPRVRQKILGVYIEVDENMVTVSPCPERLRKLVDTISRALREDVLTPDVAHRLAGKLTFVTATSFGNHGRALLRPLYGRAHEQFTSASQVHHLNTALRASLQALLRVLASIQPRQIPLSVHQPVAVVYSDAFYTPTSRLMSKNGWGYIVRFNDQVFYCNGTVPTFVLEAFCKSKAYIYFLEMVAHLLPLLILRSVLPPMVTAYIDNQPGLQALNKGYTKDLVTNCFFSVTTNLIADLRYMVHYEWVASHQNISDPISRSDISLALQHGWIRSYTSLDSFWRILANAAADFEYASGPAAHECLLAVAAFDPLEHRAKTEVSRWHGSDDELPPAPAESHVKPVESTTTATRGEKGHRQLQAERVTSMLRSSCRPASVGAQQLELGQWAARHNICEL